jgi:serine phosphatase RsbU (regulator of sigma subunit)/PAS domain-containing protein
MGELGRGLSPPPRQPAADSAGDAVAQSALDRLIAESETLRRALHDRGITDLATGLLAGRLTCGISTAFKHLNQLAQDTNTPLRETAALLIGEAVPHDVMREGSARIDLAVVTPYTHVRKAEPKVGAAPVGGPADDEIVSADFLEMLNGIPAPVITLSPVRTETGDVANFRIAQCNSEAIGHARVPADQVIGSALCDIYPEIGCDGLIGAFADALATSIPLEFDGFAVEAAAGEESSAATVDVRARPLGGGLLVSWRVHDATAERMRRLEEAERLGHLGWAEWNLVTDRVVWSEQVFQMHGRDTAHGPITLPEYPRHVHPDDMLIVDGLLRGLTERGEDTEVEFRIVAGDKARHIRVIAQPIVAAGGKLLMLRGVFQDVTGRREAEQALAASRDQIEDQRREATLRLQRAILPTDREHLSLPGYEVAVRYVPAHVGSKVGGDWYEARELSDGHGLVAVGDVGGHGLEAAATMARVGNALRGLSVTGQSADQLLTWLNTVVWQEADPETIASVVIGRLDPEVPQLSWAQAGHPAPVLIRGRTARLLSPPRGSLLGVSLEPDYEQVVEPLAAGDLLLFYTDGLIERRDQPIDQGIEVLLQAAQAWARAGASGDVRTDIDALLTYLAPTNPEDDTCVLVVKVTSWRASPGS